MPEKKYGCRVKWITDPVTGKKKCINDNQPFENTFKKVDMIDLLINTIHEPKLTYSEEDKIESETNPDYVDIPKVCFAILNYGSSRIRPETKNNFELFGSIVKEYLPERFHSIKFNRHTDWSHASKMYLDAVDRFQEWILSMQSKLENLITEEYYNQGRMRQLEILKRRYKENWSESRVVDLSADQNLKINGDSKIELKITDA